MAKQAQATKAASFPAPSKPVLLTVEQVEAQVKAGDIDLSVYRAVFLKEKGREYKGADSDIVAVIAEQVPGSEIDPKQWADLLEESEPEGEAEAVVAEPDEAAMAQAAFAAEMAAIAAQKGDKVSAMLEGAADISEKYRQAGIDMYYALLDTYGADTLSGWPMPDTTAKDVQGMRNARYDIYYQKSYTGADRKPQKRSFYGNLLASMPAGKKLDEMEETLQKVEDKAQGFDVALAEKPVATRNAMKRRFQNRRTTMRNLLKRARNIHAQLDALSTLQAVEWKFATDDEGNVYPTPKPVIIAPTGKPENYEPLSIGQVLNLDIPTAIKNGGTKAALLKTLEQGEPETTTLEPRIKDMNALQGYFNEVAAYLSVTTSSGKVHNAQLTEKVTQQGPEADDWVLSIGDTVIALDPIWSAPGFEKRYRDLSAKRQKEIAAEQAKKSNGNGKK